MNRTLTILALALMLPIGCTKPANDTSTPDDFDLPPEKKGSGGKTSKRDEAKADKKAAKQIAPPVVVPQDRDPDQEKAKLAKAHEKSAKAKQLLRAGETDKAIAEARQALREHEQDVQAMLVIAEAFYKQNKHELVQSVANSILKVDAKLLTPTEKSQAYNLMGFAYLQSGQRMDAFQAFKSAAETDDQNASAWNNLGVQYMWRGDPKTAASCFEYATTLDGKFAEAHLNLGAALRANGQFTDAEKSFQQASKVRPDWAEVHFNLGVLYLDGEALDPDAVRRYQTAIGEFERYKSMAAQGGASLERSDSKRSGPTDAMGNELVSVAQADLYIKAATKGIESEERRRDREEKRKNGVVEPEEPTSEPAPSEPGPTEPVQPQKPGAGKPAEQPPASKPAEPAKPSQPPVSKPSETPPATKPAEPAPAKPTEQPPAAKPTEPPAKPTQPAQPQKPGQQKPADPPASKPQPQKPGTQKPGG